MEQIARSLSRSRPVLRKSGGGPAQAVDSERRRRFSRAALDYLRLLRHPAVKFRFAIVEVLLLEGAVRQVRHLPNSFPLEGPYRYG